VPNLGVVQYKDGLSFVMADIPGLIEGASEGAGLGLQFLRHVERCRVLIHLLDLNAFGEGREPLHDFEVLNRELERYSPDLARRPQVVAANKVDIPEAREKLAGFAAKMKKKGWVVHPISSATGEGVGALLDAAARVLYGRAEDAPKAARAAGEPAPRQKAAKKKAPRPKAKAKAKPKAAAKGRRKPGARR
jgi:GTPase